MLKIRPNRIHLTLLAWLTIAALPIGADGLIALPNGHNLSPLFNRSLQLPAFTAQLPRAGEWFFAPAFTLAQGQSNSITQYTDGTETIHVFYDYEAYALELPLEFGLDDANAIGLDLQLFGFAGGFLDAVVSGYHGLFGFPNNSREKMPANRLLIDIPTQNGYHLQAVQARLFLADPLLWYSGRVYADPKIQVSASVLATLPLGLSGGLGGGSLPQLGFGINGLWAPCSGIVLHASSALVLPLDSFRPQTAREFISFQSRSGILFSLAGDFWIGVDISFHSSPLGNLSVPYDYGSTFNHPAADLLVSLLWHGRSGAARNGLAAFTVQEDPISHNASDVGFSFSGAMRF